MSPSSLPLIAALVAGDIVAAEDGNGTLKTILTRSVDRGQVFAAKVLAAAPMRSRGRLPAATVAIVAGVARWGFKSVTQLSGTVVSAPKALLLVIVRRMPSIWWRCCGRRDRDPALNRRSQQRWRGRRHLGMTLILAIVGADPRPRRTQPYLLTNQYLAWQGLLRTPTDWQPILHSLWVCALYAVPGLLAAYLVFLRRDVAGG